MQQRPDSTGVVPFRRWLLASCLNVDAPREVTKPEVDAAIRSGFASWLGLWLDQGRLATGAVEQATIRLASRAGAMRARDLASHLGDLLRSASQAGLQVCLLKGAALESAIYPGPGFRPMGDIDLLIAADMHPEFDKILRNEGYIQQSSQPAAYYLNHHHRMPYWHAQKGIWIEVHTRLFPSVANALLPWQETFEMGDVEVHRLQPRAHALYTVAHWAYPFPGSKGLVGLVDLGLLLRAAGMPEVQDYPLTAGERDWLLRALETACRLLPVDMPVRSPASHAPLETVRLRLLSGIALDYIVDDRPYSRWHSPSVLAGTWEALMNTARPVVALASLPWWFLFPRNHPRRFSPLFAWKRLGRLWRKQA